MFPQFSLDLTVPQEFHHGNTLLVNEFGMQFDLCEVCFILQYSEMKTTLTMKVLLS
jgi:hypothetical protein